MFSRVWAGGVSIGRSLSFSGTFIRSRSPPPALRQSRSMRACPPDRRNRPRRPRCVPRALTASSVVGDFALHEAVRGRVIGVSDPHVVQFPPINRVQAMTRVVCTLGKLCRQCWFSRAMPYAPNRLRYVFHRSRSFLPSDSRTKTSRAAALPLSVSAETAPDGDATSRPSCKTIVPSDEIVTT